MSAPVVHQRSHLKPWISICGLNTHHAEGHSTVRFVELVTCKACLKLIEQVKIKEN